MLSTGPSPELAPSAEVVAGKVERTGSDDERLRAVLSETIQHLRGEGIPVDDEARIDMGIFAHAYPSAEVRQDQQQVADAEAQFEYKYRQQGLNQERFSGERLERFVTALFNKYLPSNFVFVRTAKYDDYIGERPPGVLPVHIDNFILDRKTGNVVCAVDEFVNWADTRRGAGQPTMKEEKVTKLIAANITANGASIKYGLGVAQNGAIVPKRYANVPTFLLVVEREQLRTAQQDLRPFQERTREEQQIFLGFLNQLVGEGKNLLEVNKVKTQKGAPLNQFVVQRTTNFVQSFSAIRAGMVAQA